MAWRLAWPSSLTISVEQRRSGCFGWFTRRFVKVVTITVPPDRWKMLPGWDWLNTDAEIMADFGKLCAMDGDCRRIKVKLKHGRKTVDKWIFEDGSTLMDIVRDEDLHQDQQKKIVDIKDLSIYLVRKNEEC